MYPIIQVDAQPESIEELGTKRKFWYSAENGYRYLFKAEERGTGEDWAEKVVCELARLLGIPCVDYELAFFPALNLRGVICLNLSGGDRSLVMGNQLLGMVDPQYPMQIRKKFGVRKYTIEAVSRLVGMLAPLPIVPRADEAAPVHSALGTYIGYMLLDALVANQDRHHQNWAAIGSGSRLSLAPTFDHGSSLARNLSDDERADRLATTNPTRTVAYFATRARSEFFPLAGDKTLPVLEVFQRFADLVPAEATFWLHRLAQLPVGQMDDILTQIPPERMTPVTRRFTLELLTINQKRLLQGYTA